jgi:hypothetical protein
MTDEHNDKHPTELADDDAQQADANAPRDDFDVEAALAAVASLEHLATSTADNAPPETDEDDPADDDFDDRELLQIAAEARALRQDDPDAPRTQPLVNVTDDAPPAEDDADDDLPAAAYALDDRFTPEPPTGIPRPPLSELNRGTLASILPALLLIIGGGALTFLLTTSTAVLAPPLLAMIALGGVGVILLVQWLASARWAMGSFFIGITLLLCAVTGAYLLQGTQLSLQQGYPLFLTAIGLAFILTDIFTASHNRVWLLGLLIGIAGVGGVLVTSEALDTAWITILQAYWYVPAIIIALILITPLLRRQQEQPADD